MLEGLAADTGVIVWMMAGFGVLGILAKIVNQMTLIRLVRAAGNMPKSTHRLIKLVRAKYEHACLIHDSVENIDAFVEKYIYEYRGFLFRIHTWGQIEKLCIWFAGIMAAAGAWLEFSFFSGFSESVYQYIAAGAAEVVLLSVIMRLSDEPYKIGAVKMYMVDYLENICAYRLRKQSQREREFIDVISPEAGERGAYQASADEKGSAKPAGDRGRERAESGKRSGSGRLGIRNRRRAYAAEAEAGGEGDLPINIEGEPRQSDSGAAWNSGQRETQQSGQREPQYSEQREPQYSGQRETQYSGQRETQQSRQRGAQQSGQGEQRQSVQGEAARQAVRYAASEPGREDYRAEEKRGYGDAAQPEYRADGINGTNDRSPVRHPADEDERPALREEAIRQILEEFLA